MRQSEGSHFTGMVRDTIDTDVSRGSFTQATLASNVRKQLSEEKIDTFPWEWLLLA
jgi:hypothetical protein